MWQPKKLIIKNLFSHKDTTFNFVKNKCTMIYGINRTDSDKISNGGGKSTLLEGIVLALANETSRGVLKDDFINEEEESCYIELSLENTLSSVKSLTIKRWFHRKKSAKIELWENGAQNEEMTSVAECNARIFELIGLNKEDLLKFFLIGQDANYSFLTAGDADKKGIISRLINIDFLEQKIELLKSQVKEKNKEKAGHKEDISSINTRIEIIEDDLEELRGNFEAEKQNRIDTIVLQNKKLGEQAAEFVDKIVSAKKTVKTLEKDLAKLEKEKTDDTELKNESKTINDEINSLNKKNRAFGSEIANLKGVQSGAITCPKCKTKFLLESDVDLESIPDKILNLESDIKRNKKKIEARQKQDEKIEAELLKSQETDDEIFELSRKIKNLKRTIETNTDETNSISEKILSKQKQIDGIKKENPKLKIKELKEKKSEWDEALEIMLEEVSKIDAEIENYEYWINNFGKKGFMTFLINKSIKSIEGITNSFLKKINSNCQLSVNGYTALKSGDVNEKISINVVENGHMTGNYFKYSGGERGRIKLMNILGLQSLMNMNCPSGGLNLLILDEVFEGLDSKGQTDVIKILEELKITSLVVTHRSEPIGAENEIFIEKVDRISRVIEKNIYL